MGVSINDRVLDLSEHSSKNIDWKKIRQAGYKIILRIGIRGSVKANKEYYGKIRFDFKFKQYLEGVVKYGIPFTIYFFPTSINDAEADEEAEWILQQIRELGLKLCMPVFLDSELVDDGDGRADGLSKEKRTRFLRIICDKLWAAGIPCGIYASTSWFYSKLDMTKFDTRTRANTWCAQYASGCDYSGSYAMWQYSSKAQIDGIPTAPGKGVDISRVVRAFRMDTYAAGEMAESAADPVPANDPEPAESGFVHSRSAIVSEAISHIGIKEGTTLHHRIIDRYNSHKPLARGYAVKYTDAWCATFVSYLAIVMGYTDIIPTECGCPQMITLAKQMGIWCEDDSYTPLPGDIPLYDWQDSGAGDNTGTPDHIGITEKVANGIVTVIEGNYKDAVGRREIPVNGRYIRGYIVPRYDAENAPAGQEKADSAPVTPQPAPAVDEAHTIEYYALINTKKDPLNIRKGPGSNYDQCSFSPLAKGTKVGVCKHKSGKWYLIAHEVNGEMKYGYAYCTYLKKI